MEKWVNHLVEDRKNAHRIPPVKDEKNSNEPQFIEEHFAEVERWLESEPQFTFAQHCGINPDYFPPQHMITDEQLLLLYKSFEALLFSWNLHVDIPESFPKREAYPLIITALNRKVDIEDDGFTTIEFCQYSVKDCLFKEHCTCKDIPFDEMETGTSNDEILF
ncbi:MAG: hypothetical protein K2X48_20085 [Chitinophagaceae bacterium]|nr:hypothetical protein [Chitinophagaceae bacterium]